MVTREQAEERVKLGFGIHLAVYVLVIAGLAILNLTRNPDKLWFLWVAGGWGLGVLLHGGLLFFVPDARERMINRMSARMERREMRQERREMRQMQ